MHPFVVAAQIRSLRERNVFSCICQSFRQSVCSDDDTSTGTRAVHFRLKGVVVFSDFKTFSLSEILGKQIGSSMGHGHVDVMKRHFNIICLKLMEREQHGKRNVVNHQRAKRALYQYMNQ